MYDRNTQQFTRISNMQMRRSRVGVAISGTKIYCLGGYDGSKNLKSVECYDVEGEEWSEGEEMQLHDGGVGVCTMLPQLWTCIIVVSQCACYRVFLFNANLLRSREIKRAATIMIVFCLHVFFSYHSLKNWKAVLLTCYFLNLMIYVLHLFKFMII